ncbi:MAG TPA: class II aldolase/adducin family protein [Polyangia bacterium]|nr:class II aldolase/adducin family protein [Polyangia bacterium]HVY38055.1 class II aldolase/adducin family protein [Polyangia bacterium]
MPNAQSARVDLVSYVEEAKRDAIFVFEFLRDSGTLSASLTFNLTHRIPGHDKLLSVRFPQPWSKDRNVVAQVSDASEHKELVIDEPRLEADTFVHAHTPYLAAWSLAHKSFPILYVAAQRHLLAREIPNHLERTRSALDVIRERLDKHPELAPPPALLESNGGANFWGRGIVKTGELILLIEEGARLQAIAEQIGGARQYTPGALDLQWKRTGLLERARSFAGDYAPTSR